MQKKRVLLGFVGKYRTFEKTFDNIRQNLIVPNSYKYEFDIYVNTDLINKEIHDPWNKPKNPTNYSQDVLENKFNELYGSMLQKITYYNNEDFYASGGLLYLKRISLIIQSIPDDTNYDIFFFIRFDGILSKKLLFENITYHPYYRGFLYIVCNEELGDDRIDHNHDWDFCVFSNNKESILDYSTCATKDITLPELIDYSYKINFRTRYLRECIAQTKLVDSWVLNSWKIFYNLYKKRIFVNFMDNESLWCYLVR